MGNKSKHLRYIIPYIPQEYNRYIEPFVGSGAIFLKLEPEKWIINDLNKDLISCWKHIKENPTGIIKEIKSFGKAFRTMSKKEKIEYCKKYTDKLNNMKPGIKRTSNFMLMKFCSYMGVITRKNKFVFNGLELSLHKKRPYFLDEPMLNNILDVSDYLNDTYGKIYNKDYRYVLNKAKNRDFVFLDPPYMEDHDYNFQYNIGEDLNREFIEELLKEVKKLDKRGVMWMMTQAETPAIKLAFKGYRIKKIKVYRLKRGYVNELLIMNYDDQYNS